MQREKLDLTNFEKAVKTLDVALKEYAKDESNEFVKDSCIQRFEYCYELATRMIKRYLKITSASPVDIEQMPFQDIIRTAYSKNITKNSWDKWHQYRESRNKTSHAYNMQKAKEVLENIPYFYDEIEFLLQRLKENEAQI